MNKMLKSKDKAQKCINQDRFCKSQKQLLQFSEKLLILIFFKKFSYKITH